MDRRSLLLSAQRPPTGLGVLAAVLGVAAVTLLIYPLKTVMPVVSTGVLYLMPVLAVSIWWGLRLGLLTSLLGTVCFNFFHIPPVGKFTIAEPAHWVALGAFLVTAVIASSVADLARTRAEEADARRRDAALAAEMAGLLLAGAQLRDALEATAARIAEAVGFERARIALGEVADAPGETRIPLMRGNRQVGTLIVGDLTDDAALAHLRDRVAPALETLLAAAIDRDRLQTEAIEARALRRSDDMKTALLRAVSHDLRTPLTAIIAAGDALASPALDEGERRELSAAVTGESSRLARMVEQLLDLSKLEAGAAEPRREWSSVEEIARAAIEDLGGEGFKLAVDRDVPLVRVDGAQLERALVNALDNARRHSGGKPVSIRARWVGERVVIRVVDQGSGIPQKELERVFEPFYRAGTIGGDPVDHGGSGLGLAIAKGFVEANGGRIWAESLPGQGTVIVVELPVQRVPAPRPGLTVAGGQAG